LTCKGARVLELRHDLAAALGEELGEADQLPSRRVALPWGQSKPLQNDLISAITFWHTLILLISSAIS
jgi:hypothetical protein